MLKYTHWIRLSSSSTMSMMAILRRLTPDARRLGDGFAHELFAQLLVARNPTSHDAFRRLVGELLAQVAESAACRASGSRMRFIHASCPPSCTHVGITPVRPVELALYVYMSAVILQAVLLRLLDAPDQLVELVPVVHGATP